MNSIRSNVYNTFNYSFLIHTMHIQHSLRTNFIRACFGKWNIFYNFSGEGGTGIFFTLNITFVEMLLLKYVIEPVKTIIQNKEGELAGCGIQQSVYFFGCGNNCFKRCL